MAERKAVNKYYPPDWDPRKGSANKRVGQHPLRDRAKKLSQGILVIRFELPYNIWCGGCGSHIGMGVRYNAEKSKVGNYYSTPIYKFRMKCHLCDNYFEIQTDPKNHDYVILNGARRKEQRWDPVANEQVVPEDKSTQKKLATDPMFKLEHGSNDQQRGKDKVLTLAQIEESRAPMKDDYILNRMARDKFRTEKKQLKELADADRAILDKAALDIALVEETEEDKKLAGLLKYAVTSSFEEKQNERRKSIEQRPLFDTNKSSTSLPSMQSSSSANLTQHNGLKHKLSRALQATYKDPFKSVKKKIFKTKTPWTGLKLAKNSSFVVVKRKKSGKEAEISSMSKVSGTFDFRKPMTKPDTKLPAPANSSLSDSNDPINSNSYSVAPSTVSYQSTATLATLQKSHSSDSTSGTQFSNAASATANDLTNATNTTDTNTTDTSCGSMDTINVPNSSLEALMSSYVDSDSDSGVS
ncbi:unnamed protein product [Lymnaea stagnalis]|uniref:Coiled-coil domain-containing protein 130 n=1 Tax=Lymnaea stagnalis TaxID=6523 RepID=A0AAV2HWZ0_LYMST